MQTHSGIKFYPMDPKPDDILIEDIAHALSLQCRFNGHVREFYSVAQHSVLVSMIVPPEVRMHGLLHDAPECYLGDIITPIKDLFEGVREIEDGLEKAIFTKYGMGKLWESDHESVNTADKTLLVTEARDLLASDSSDWDLGFDPMNTAIYPVPSDIAEKWFLQVFRNYMEQMLAGK